LNKVLKPLLSVLVVLIVSGCATSDLSYNNENIHLRIKDASFLVKGKTLEAKHDNFSTLFLTQKLVRLDDATLVVFEEARTDMQYKFEPTTSRSIKIIFDAKQVIRVHYNTFIYAFQVVLKDHRMLNVLVAQSHNQRLQMLYGMSTDKMKELLSALGQDVKPVLYKDVIDLRYEPTPFMSQWSIHSVHLVPLVVPFRPFGFI